MRRWRLKYWEEAIKEVQKQLLGVKEAEKVEKEKLPQWVFRISTPQGKVVARVELWAENADEVIRGAEALIEKWKEFHPPEVFGDLKVELQAGRRPIRTWKVSVSPK